MLRLDESRDSRSMARAAARPSTDTKSTQSANFLTMCPGTFASCFSAVLDSSMRTHRSVPLSGEQSSATAKARCPQPNGLPTSCGAAARTGHTILRRCLWGDQIRCNGTRRLPRLWWKCHSVHRASARSARRRDASFAVGAVTAALSRPPPSPGVPRSLRGPQGEQRW
jgi:hypothetical protein